MSPRTLKILAVGYAVKTLLVGLAWLAIPDLPARAANHARRTWAAVVGSKSESAPRP